MELSNICWRLEEGRFCGTLNDCFWHTFPFLQFFSIFTVKLYRGSTTLYQIDFFILALIEAWTIHFRSTLKSAYNKSKAFFKIIFCFTWKEDYPVPFIQFGSNPTLFPLQILSIHFLCHIYEYILFQ